LLEHPFLLTEDYRGHPNFKEEFLTRGTTVKEFLRNWPDFMLKHKRISYRSEKINGLLYR